MRGYSQRAQHPGTWATVLSAAKATSISTRSTSRHVILHTARAQAAVVASTRWKSLSPHLIWQGEPTDLLKPSAPPAAPVWKMFLLSDGSVTRHLQMLTGRPITVDCLQMAQIGSSYDGLLFGPDIIPGDLVERQVVLRCGPRGPPAGALPPSSSSAGRSSGSSSSGESSSSGSSSDGLLAEGTPLVYAASWWNAADVARYLKDARKPIWVSLSEGHVELWREVQGVHLGACPDLQALLQCEGEGALWGRYYVFWHDGRPLTLIYEVFSPRVQQLLGLPPAC